MSDSTTKARHAPMPSGAEIAGLEGLAYVTFEKVEQLRVRLADAAEPDKGEWATAAEAWLLTWGASEIVERCEQISKEAKQLQGLADTLYLNAVEAGQTPEYPDSVRVTTETMERVAAERRVDFPDRFEADG